MQPMEIMIILWLMTCYMRIRPTASVTVSCGENMCLCDDKALSALCKPVKREPSLSYFPKLPNYINDLTIRNFKRRNVTKEALTNLTYLSLKALQLENMDISNMEEGLFQPFSTLKVLEISSNRKLSSETLREAFRNISKTLEKLILTNNNLKHVAPDMFRHLSNTNLAELKLARNPMLNLKQDVFKYLNLTTLDLSSSTFSDLRIICPKESTSLLTHLLNLQLQSTKVKHIPTNFVICFPYLEKLNLRDNKFNSFPTFCDMFHFRQNFKNNLQELNLINTGLNENTSAINVSCLSNLTILHLDRNKLTRIPNFCNHSGKASLPSLRRLHLRFTSISNLMEDSFKCLSSLRILDLRNNVLIKLPNFCSENNSNSYTPELTELYLRDTSILTLDNYKLRCLRHLKELDLRSNLFKCIPPLWFCDESKKSLNPFLRKLDLSSNPIQHIHSENFRCLSSLTVLRLSFTSISKLGDNIFSTMRSLKQLEITNSKNLKRISMFAFNISNLVTLKFSFNDFNFEDATKYSPEQLFGFCQNLRNLILSGNHFPTTPLAHKILLPLGKLENLSLAENRMHTIHEDTLKSSKNLNKLLLGQNRLTGWNENVFKNLSKLRHLDLAHNAIVVFNKTSVPMSILNRLRTFGLAYNPFDCGCDMIWFRNWTLTTNVTLLSFPEMYSCKTPPSMFRQSLLSLHLTEEDCKEKNPWLIVIVSVSAGALLLLCIFITISVQMPTIKNYMYYLRLKKAGYVKLINEQEFAYDAYVVYCESDETWIIRTLVPRLESEGFRLCIPDREFEVGADRCDQIVSAFKESRKILVVLSDNFAKNEWCLWQMKLVEERIRQSGNSAVVFVLYKNISSKSMISSLHRTVKERPIVTWYEGGSREKVFWKVIALALRAPLGEPPVAVIN